MLNQPFRMPYPQTLTYVMYSHLSNKRGGWNIRGGWDFLEKTST